MSRPEDTVPADLYYNDTESRKYTTSSRIQHIQTAMTRRALALLALPSPSLILDIGCGSGLSGALLSSLPAEEGGPHHWVGLDVSHAMLGVALERDAEGDLFLADAGQGVPFRPGAFDAAISISAVQWLCGVERAEESAAGRLARFFAGLYASLRRGARAVCQFYPRDRAQREMVTGAAVRAGFGAGLLIDDEGTKSEKTYLVLSVGGGDITGVIGGLEGEIEVEDQRRRARERGKVSGRQKAAMVKGSKAWILKKKDQAERKGMVVKPNSRYTGRKRRIKF
ncbi:MAG: hypothetical protein M1821_006471 [Bathelium mastoideum]|nr:MAG: hypothetical protein M1821_006471 [Bathelium mastoideum]KAI9693746.1 MAG: hypothetical protein M1822_003017 [Bathelium mastoideum]